MHVKIPMTSFKKNTWQTLSEIIVLTFPINLPIINKNCPNHLCSMETYTFSLDQKDIEKELNCVICLTLPTEVPFQCQDCDSIMCKNCFDMLNNKQACPFRCKNPKYERAKPKTMMLFDCLQVRCEKCFLNVKSLEIKMHQATCGKPLDSNKTFETTNHLIDETNVSNSQKQPSMTKKPGVPELEYAPPIQNYQFIEINQRPPRIPRSRKWFFWLSLFGLVTLVVMGVITYLGLKIIFFDTNMEFQWVCVGALLFDDKPKICFLSLGQFSVGIIAIGQICVGIFTIAQCGIGLLFGFGMAIGGCGYSIAMMTIGCYVKAAMIGIGLYKVDKAILGVHCLYSLKTSKSCYSTVADCCRNNNT